MKEEEVLEWSRLIDKVAHSVARNFPDSSVDDIIQGLWVALLEAQEKNEWLSPSTKHVESGLWYAGKTMAWHERKEHLTISAQYGYRTEDVRRLMEVFFEKECWPGSWTPEDAESELGDVGLEMQSDLSRAWKRLSTSHRVLIFTKFALKENVDSRKLSKALGRVADILNTYQPQKRHNGPGRRSVISNAHADYLIGNMTEE